MNLKNKNKGVKMKYLIFSLMVFASFQAFSKDCNITNYKKFIFNKKATEDLIKKTGVGCNLSKADLTWARLEKTRGSSNAILLKANLSEAYLIRAKLREANLQEANLLKANLYWADLSGADLSEADLSGADLRFANLSGANFQWANLYGANLYRADLSGANLNAGLGDAGIGGKSYKLNLNEANLTGASIPWKYKHLLTKKQQKQVGEFVELEPTIRPIPAP